MGLSIFVTLTPTSLNFNHMKKFYCMAFFAAMTPLMVLASSGERHDAEASGSCIVSLDLFIEGALVTANATGSGATSEYYSIDWGDGTTTLDSTGTHEFLSDGNYEICVSYGDLIPEGCYVTDCETVTIIGTGVSGDCTLDLTTFPVGLTVGLQATGSGAISPSYQVNWGDDSPIETMVPATHNYVDPGTYNICVTYTDLEDPTACTVVVCQDVTVEESTSACSVELALSVLDNVVTATAVGTGADSPQYAITWSEGFPTFGNSGTHTYASSGTYEVCATYLDTDNIAGCNATDCESVTIAIGVSESMMSSGAIRIMPNPLNADGVLEITLNNSAMLYADLVDLMGNSVLHLAAGVKGQGIHRIPLDVTTLASGIYFVRVKAGNQQKTVKVVKQ